MRFEIIRVSGKPLDIPSAYEGVAHWTNSYGSNEEKVYFIEVTSLEDLIKLMKEADSDLILSDFSLDDETGYSIKIYDDYLE